MSPFVTLDGAGWVVPRAGNASISGLSGWTDLNMNGTENMILNEYKIEAAKSIRMSTIILNTFNTIAAFATAMGILFDSYCRIKRNNRHFKFR